MELGLGRRDLKTQSHTSDTLIGLLLYAAVEMIVAQWDSEVDTSARARTLLAALVCGARIVARRVQLEMYNNGERVFVLGSGGVGENEASAGGYPPKNSKIPDGVHFRRTSQLPPV